MTTRELVRTITNRLKPGTVMQEKLKLKSVFWPVAREENLAFAHWPELFRKSTVSE
jgi:hypothetical protein